MERSGKTESLGAILRRLARQLGTSDSYLSDDDPRAQDETLGDPDCCVCGGIGWVRRGWEDVSNRSEYANQTNSHPRRTVTAPCQCRAAAIAAVRLERLRKAANLPFGESDPRTFDNFVGRTGSEHAVAAAVEWAEGQGPHVLVLMGAFGTGKTHIMEAAARRLIDRDVAARCEFVPDLLDRVKATFGADAEEGTDEVLAQYETVDALLLDDLGAHNATPWSRSQLVSLIDARYRSGGRLMVTTNYMRREDMARDMDGRVASRLWDTRSGAVRTVVMLCGDYRAHGAA